MESRSGVGLVVLNYRRADLTVRCVESVLSGTITPDRIVVVDNASGAKDEAILRRLPPEVELIVAEENLGYAGGNNLGIQRLLDDGADRIWLLNNDTRVDAACLSELEGCINADAELGAVAATVLTDEADPRVWYGGGRYLPALGEVVHDNWMADPATLPGPAQPTDFLTGCCILVRAAAVKDVGLLDATLFLYWEDVEWCWRLKGAGWQLAWVPRARLRHAIGASSDVQGGSSATFLYYLCRNRILLARRLGSRGVRPLVWTPMFLGRWSWRVVRGRHDVLQQLWALVVGTWHGAAGRTGRGPYPRTA